MVKTRLSFVWWQPKANSKTLAKGCVTESHSGIRSDAIMFVLLQNSPLSNGRLQLHHEQSDHDL